ncbi:helix-turn-helix domain-containing protein [Numidum massiliense]|uniref:helix-turn-helix domain-containing protein n=1 Tax=Numidum massiliense TaxID=1522315 RepID=UPI00094026B4|nr:helix-turn-helix transcriptional regulator [Numidum massiliense]
MRQWLIDTRQSKGLTQQHVACLAGISRSYYSQIESGAKTPGKETAKKVAHALQCHVALFYLTKVDDWCVAELNKLVRSSQQSVVRNE